MEFKDLKVGDQVYILESSGTFRKVNTYNIGTVIEIGQQYDDNTSNPYLNQMLKRKLVDVTISCEGIQKRLTVGADKTSITDNTIGLTVSTNKEELVTQINNKYKEYQDKISAIELYKEEAEKCKKILQQLNGIQQQKTIKEDKPENTGNTIRVS